MKIDVNKAGEVSQRIAEFGNKKPNEMFSECAQLIQSMPENPYRDAIVKNFTEVESFYNTEWLPVLRKNNEVLTETLPEFKKKVEELGVSLVSVKSTSVEAGIKDFDLGGMSI